MRCAEDYGKSGIDGVATMGTYTHDLASFKSSVAVAQAELGTKCALHARVLPPCTPTTAFILTKCASVLTKATCARAVHDDAQVRRRGGHGVRWPQLLPVSIQCQHQQSRAVGVRYSWVPPSNLPRCNVRVASHSPLSSQIAKVKVKMKVK